jgi:hypothetical protein
MGYLPEDAATNLVTVSEDMTHANYTIGATDSFTVTNGVGNGPEGTALLNEIKITDATDEVHQIRTNDHSTTADVNYVLSCFMRQGEIRYTGLGLYTSNENHATVVFDLALGIVTATDVGITSGTINDSGIYHVGDGLFFCWAAMETGETDATAWTRLASFASASPTFNAGGMENYVGTANDKFYAGHIQFETGDYPTSYVKDGGTRAADKMVLTLAGYFADAAGYAAVDMTTGKRTGPVEVLAGTSTTQRVMGITSGKFIDVDAGATSASSTGFLTNGVRFQGITGWRASDGAQSAMLNGDASRNLLEQPAYHLAVVQATVNGKHTKVLENLNSASTTRQKPRCRP